MINNPTKPKYSCQNQFDYIRNKSGNFHKKAKLQQCDLWRRDEQLNSKRSFTSRNKEKKNQQVLQPTNVRELESFEEIR